jgi:hypothetical protein
LVPPDSADGDPVKVIVDAPVVSMVPNHSSSAVEDPTNGPRMRNHCVHPPPDSDNESVVNVVLVATIRQLPTVVGVTERVVAPEVTACLKAVPTAEIALTI